MANKGKSWLPDHDEYLSQNVAESNEQLADTLGRSAHAVECRRVSLAVALSEKDPSVSLDECISRFGADKERTKRRFDKQGGNKIKRARITVAQEQVLVQTEDKTIAKVAECLRLNDGDMSVAWADSEFVPVMIQNHSGFEAYASFLRGRGNVIKK
jgi:hypothetical protein